MFPGFNGGKALFRKGQVFFMKLGISYTPRHGTPDEWAAFLEALGCTAAVCPIASGADGDTIAAYREAAARHNVTIAEVGVWNSPIADDEAARAKALDYAKGQLRLADQIGALCCVNVAGSTGPNWSFGCRKDRTPEGYERIVSSVREIIDDVQPQRTYYTIECMPIVPPTSPDEYLRLLADVGRDRFSVHLDPFNMIFTPDRYFWSAEFFHECFEKLGPRIKSIHAKSVLLSEELTFCIHEAPIMEGGVDFDAFLREVGRLAPEMPVIIEHRNSLDEYRAALSYVRERAAALGVPVL